MLAELLPLRRSWLQDSIDRFLTHLASRRYATGTLQYNARLLMAFADFAAQERTCDIGKLPQCVDPFIATMRGGEKYRWKRRSLLRRFIRFLQEQRIIPASPSQPPSHDSLLAEDYLRSLREQRGLCTASVELHRCFCQAFMAYLIKEGIDDFHALRPEVIHRFIACDGKRYCRYTLRQRCSMLRGFLSFLYRRGIVAWFNEEWPRFLPLSPSESLPPLCFRRRQQGSNRLHLRLAVDGSVEGLSEWGETGHLRPRVAQAP